MPFTDPENLRRYRRDRYRVRVELLQDIKLEKGCADCGYNEYAEVLDFDHRPGTDKKYVPAYMPRMKLGIATIMAELEKCDVVCANCHRVRTLKRKEAQQQFYETIDEGPWI